jgi:hypothetical protein
MADSGELPPLDAAIFADTGSEPQHVYDHLQKLIAAVSVPVYIVGRDQSLGDMLTSPEGRFVSIPYYTLSDSGKAGIGRRQCTREFKIEPIHRKAREIMGVKRVGRVARNIRAEQWIGFSTDELSRVTSMRAVEHLIPRYPLVELGMSRADCIQWLTDRGWSAAKSACVICPYRSDSEWRDLRDNHPTEWRKAIRVDEAIRKGGLGGSKLLDGRAFLHPSHKPLALAPIDDGRNLGTPGGCSPHSCHSADS